MANVDLQNGAVADYYHPCNSRAEVIAHKRKKLMMICANKC